LLRAASPGPLVAGHWEPETPRRFEANPLPYPNTDLYLTPVPNRSPARESQQCERAWC